MTITRILLVAASLFSSVALYGGSDNIAPKSKITASGSASSETASTNIADGVIHAQGRGEWSSGSTQTFWGQIDYPWVAMEWGEPQTINRVVIYDRPQSDCHTAGGDLVFDDGSRITVYGIPNDGSPHEVTFEPRTTRSLRFNVLDGDGVGLGLSEIEVFNAPSEKLDYVARVDPYIESARGRYFFCITGNQPFGMIGAAPLTRNKNQYGGGYNYNSTELLGFPQIHCWMLSGLTMMPTTGGIDPRGGQQGWKSPFMHQDEIIQPGYHRLYLKRYNTWVEQTTTDRVSIYRMTYTRDAEADLLLNLGGYVGTSTMTNAQVRKVSDTELEGSFDTRGRLWGGPGNVRIFFTARFERPFERLDGWDDTVSFADIDSIRTKDGTTPRVSSGWSYHDAPSGGVSARYNVRSGDTLLMKMSISYVSCDNARENMAAECDHWDFDRVRSDSRDEWNRWFSRIDVQGGTPKQQVKFYTDLWHTLLGRHKLDDVNGQYPDYTQGTRVGAHTPDARLIVRQLPIGKDGKPRHHMYNSDAFWLSQWNLNILWGLAYPEVLDDFSASLVQYADNGGLLPRGPCAGGYSYIMTGCPATNLIVSAYNKGVLTKTDPRHAFDVMKRNHMPGGMMEINDFYIKNGYVSENAGVTIEVNFQDWALSQMALKMGRKADAREFARRSQGWQKLYNSDQKLIFPKNEKGEWTNLNPLDGNGWVEANAWQATWSVSHQIDKLAEMMGGGDSLCAKLNYAFEQAADDDFVFGYSGGHISYANQPGCSNAHVFNHAGQPWLTQYWVRRVNEQAYGSTTPDRGYGGHDEDQGQMGGVSALMSMGLFSLRGTCDAEPVYELTSPVFDRVTITPHKDYYSGGKFTIRSYNNSAQNCYIQRAALNGQPLDSYWFYHRDFARGGELEIWLGDKPNVEWGVAARP